jgi:hypothetical protein
MRGVRRPAAACTFAALFFSAAPGAADMTKAQCVSVNSNAQDLRRAGKLTEALENLRQCSAPSCPAIVRDDCTQRIDEVQRAQPTIIFDIKDGAGRDLIDVTATVDGQTTTRKIDGSAWGLDPGGHAFVFTEPGQQPVTQTFVLREGEKDRRERIVIGTPPPPATATLAPAPTASLAPSEFASKGMPSQKVAALVVGGVGLAGVAAGTVFGLLTFSAASQQKSACASSTTCANYAQASSAHSTGETDATLSTVTFIGGGALVAAGAILFLTSPHVSEQPLPAMAVVIAPGLAPGGGGIWARGEF